ncbi:MAG: nuclear transport factor 2 family protein [Gammaproteobacteria bacterium]|nr:nuclear transport factor 2 family protein [Gammaproteobacteria bacterium]
MKGFDPKWRDLPDYILGVTREIWEERNIARLNEYYASDIVVRSPGCVVLGNQAVIQATLATLAQFPDRQLLGEDVICSGDEETGFLSSHRILSTATHAMAGAFGAPAGKALRYRTIADCAVRDNQIYDEWLVRDQGAIVRQLGVEPKCYAAELIEWEGGPHSCAEPWTRARDVVGRYQGGGNKHPVGARYAGILQRIMDADMAVISREYDRACQLELPGGETGHGHGAAYQFWLNLLSALPDAEFRIDHMIGRDDPGERPRAAMRWTLSGTHDGWGAFGAPSGAPIDLLAISHAEFGPRGLSREFVLIDETAIWKQIALHTG